MIEKLLIPKSEGEIIHDINNIKSPVKRFVRLFEFYFKKCPGINIEELVNHLKDRSVNIKISANRIENIEMEHKGMTYLMYNPIQDIQYEIIVSLNCNQYERQYEQQVISIRNNQIFYSEVNFI